MANQKYGVGDIVTIRDEGILAKVAMPIQDEDGSWWYEVAPVEFDGMTREVAQKDLRPAR